MRRAYQVYLDATATPNVAVQVALQNHRRQRNRNARLARAMIMHPAIPMREPVEGTPLEPAIVAQPKSAVTPSASLIPWLTSVSFFIPRSVREPFFGDLQEDLATMAREGRSRAFIRWAAVSQVGALVLRWLWSNGFFRH